VKRESAGDEGGDEKSAESGTQKQKFLPTGLSRAIVLATIIGTIIIAAANVFIDRYDLVAAPASPNGFMYRIDHLTGGIKFCGPQGCTDVQVQAPK